LHTVLQKVAWFFLRPTDVADESILSVNKSTFWLLFTLFASALALKDEKVFTWMRMSTHTQEEMITLQTPSVQV